MQALKWVLNVLIGAKEKVWDFFDGFNDDKLYVINKFDVIQKYIDYKVDDIEEFAATYTYERHDIMGNLDDRQSKEEMFKEVCEILGPLKIKRNLNH